MALRVEQYDRHTVTMDLLYQVSRIRQKVWPDRQLTQDAYIPIVQGRFKKRPDMQVFVGFERDQVVTHAVIFPREIKWGGVLMPVTALASVFTDPERQGRGYASQVVSKAFAVVEQQSLPVVLFQTGVPDFYERLGATAIHNKWVNTVKVTDVDYQMWWDGSIMIYPKTASWPEGELDLNGEAW